MRKDMNLVNGIPVSLGEIEGMIYGGPFRNYVQGTRRLVGVKMAVEIDHPHEFRVDTRDFSIPKQEDMQRGIGFAIQSLASGKDVYAGCMGGIGRTGLFMACMAAVMRDFAERHGSEQIRPADPVAFVRTYYMKHAVETQEQKDFVDNFDTEPAVDWLTDYHYIRSLTMETLRKPVEPLVPMVVEKIVYLGPISWVLQSMGQLFKAPH